MSELDSGGEHEEGLDDSSDEEETAEDLGIGLGPSNKIARMDSDGFSYSVLEPEQIVKYMSEMIRDVADILKFPSVTCRMLLHHFKWNKDKLIDTYYGTPDPNKIFLEAKMASPLTSPQALASVQTSHLPSEEVCQICFQELPTSMLTGLHCGHRFCRKCWVMYLTTKMMDEGRGQSIPCAALKCEMLVDETMVMGLIKDPPVLRRYQQLITDSFVSCHRLLCWCPAADCGRVVRVTQFDSKSVTCSCGCVFCFSCGHECHDPPSCHLLKLWVKKCKDDSETSNWIIANTKDCPKCHVTIEKNGGCNHMTCTNLDCKAEFCWVCLYSWRHVSYQSHTCNRFDDSATQKAHDAQERSRAALHRYVHHYDRYMNHMQSLKFENKLYEMVKCKMEQMQKQSMCWAEVQFLNRAVDVLCQCRRTLMYSYVFAFYLVKSNQSMIFEDNQQDLEAATEQLSEILERDLDSENLNSLRQKVQDKSVYCDIRRQALLSHCREGDDNGSWEFTH